MLGSRSLRKAMWKTVHPTQTPSCPYLASSSRLDASPLRSYPAGIGFCWNVCMEEKFDYNEIFVLNRVNLENHWNCLMIMKWSHDFCFSTNVSHCLLNSGPQVATSLKPFLVIRLFYDCLSFLSLPSLIHQLFEGLLLHTFWCTEWEYDIAALFFSPSKMRASMSSWRCLC